MARKRKTTPSLPADQRNDPRALFSHSLAAMGDERWQEAAETLQSFLKLVDGASEQHRAYQNLSVCYLEMERYEETLAALEQVERLNPGLPETFFTRAIAYACQGNTSQAISAFERFASLQPKRARLHNIKDKLRRLRSIERGEIPPASYLVDHLQEHLQNNIEVEDFDIVERKARRMIAADPNRAEGHFNLGVACLEQGRPLEALESLQQAHRLEPKHIVTLYNLGYTLMQLDRPQEAIPYLEQVVHQDRKHLHALHELGRAYNSLGRRADAIQLWKQVLKIDPDEEPTQWRLYEVGEGPKPVEPPLTAQQNQLRQMIPLARQRMRQPRIYQYRDICLTVDPQVGYILEDSGNNHNLSVYAGGPFVAGALPNADLLDLIGNVKMLLRMISGENTRDIAILTYYQDGSKFNYQAHFKRGERVEYDAAGHFVVTQVPYFFKLRMDSDLDTFYGSPMQGMAICLRQDADSAVAVYNLGMQPTQPAHPRLRLWGS